VLLWALEGTLESESRELIGERADVVFVSAASIWEIEIKQAQGRIAVPGDFLSLIEQTGFEALAVSSEHAVEVARLPLLHRDPFDRMLVAQARIEGLTLASADRELARYDVHTRPVLRSDPQALTGVGARSRL
jgi:PIN domain nuclease of toxin-antitoxin system